MNIELVDLDQVELDSMITFFIDNASDLVAIGGVAFLAATLAAVTGFGGAAVLLPVLVLRFGIRDAVPILTIAQLIGNGSRAWLNRDRIDYSVIRWFSFGAIPLALVGGVYFSQAPIPLLQRLLGLFLILSVVWRHLRNQAVPVNLRLKNFAFIGGCFSFLSALIGSVGPLMAPFFLAYGLTKGAYIGTEAMATVVMHVFKLMAYGGTSILTYKGLAIGTSLGGVMFFGSVLGKNLLDRLPDRIFVLLVEGVLLFSGAKFLFFSS